MIRAVKSFAAWALFLYLAGSFLLLLLCNGWSPPHWPAVQPAETLGTAGTSQENTTEKLAVPARPSPLDQLRTARLEIRR